LASCTTAGVSCSTSTARQLTARDSARAQHERLDEQVKSAEALALAHDRPAKTGRDKTRLDKLADEVADRDNRATSLGAAIAAIEREIRQRASADYHELLEEAVAEHLEERCREREAADDEGHEHRLAAGE